MRSRAVDLALLSALSVAQPAPGADPGTCDKYAKSALAQLQRAQKLGIPGLQPPVWSNDYSSHYGWCLAVPESETSKGAALRQSILNGFSKNAPTGQEGSWLPKPVEAKPVQVEVLLPPGVKKTCDSYAWEAVQQQQYNLRSSCGQKGPEWNDDYGHHYSWCIRGDNYRGAADAAARRNALLSTCTAGGCPVMAPGLTVGLRHSGNGPKDPGLRTAEAFGSCSPKVSLVQLRTPDVEPGGFGRPSSTNNYWEWANIVVPATKASNQYPLPPGVVIGLSGDEFTAPTAFGVIPFHGPEYLPGGMFRRATGGDIGREAGRGLFWYESTGVGFTDWPSVNRLPRGTIVALRHSDTQRLPGAIGSLGGKTSSVQEVVWQGKALDPRDSTIEPPPGFVVKHGGDLGAEAGHGYSWYEKTAGR